MDDQIIIIIIVLLMVLGLLMLYRSKTQAIIKSKDNESDNTEDDENNKYTEYEGTCVYKPPCPSGYILDKTSRGESCCYVSDDEYIKSQQDKLAEELAIRLGFTAGLLTPELTKLMKFLYSKSLGKLIKTTPIMPTITKLINQFANSILRGASTRFTSAATSVLAKAGIKMATFVAQRGIMAAKGIANAASLVGKVLTSKAFLAFSIITLALDITDVGGYNEFRTKEFYKELKQLTDLSMKVEIENEGGSLLVGPLDYIEAKKLEQAIETITVSILFGEELGDIAKVIHDNQLTDEQAAIYLEDQMHNINYDTIAKKAYKKLCEDSGGLSLEDGGCSFKEADCLDYPWPLPTDGSQGYMIRRFVDGKCISEDPTIRLLCEEHDLEYDKYTGICKITPQYCAKRGVDWAYNPKIGEYDCTLPAGQIALETVFGTQIVRALKAAGK
jgi:hypothetical protein